MKRYIIFCFCLFVSWIIVEEIYARENNVRIDVIYFHATIRCNECLAIEEFTKNVINTVFSKEMQTNLITFTSLDFMLPENEHYQKDYDFETQSLIISKKVNGKEVKWKNLGKIWDYVGNYEKFRKYVEKEIRKFL